MNKSVNDSINIPTDVMKASHLTAETVWMKFCDVQLCLCVFLNSVIFCKWLHLNCHYRMIWISAAVLKWFYVIIVRLQMEKQNTSA